LRLVCCARPADPSVRPCLCPFIAPRPATPTLFPYTTLFRSARSYQLILRTTGLDSDQGPTAAKYILEKVKPQRIAIVHDKQQYGEGLARAVQDGLKKGNANVVFFDGITAGEKDFSTLVARLKKENIDFVYYGGYHPEMGQILRQARAAGLKTQFMGPEGVANV